MCINYQSDKTSKEDLDLCVCRWAGLSAAAGGGGETSQLIQLT